MQAEDILSMNANLSRFQYVPQELQMVHDIKKCLLCPGHYEKVNSGGFCTLVVIHSTDDVVRHKLVGFL